MGIASVSFFDCPGKNRCSRFGIDNIKRFASHHRIDCMSSACSEPLSPIGIFTTGFGAISLLVYFNAGTIMLFAISELNCMSEPADLVC